MEHHRVQLIGGIILHQGRIAEMKTGEGKTLVSTLPAYLNALTGRAVSHCYRQRLPGKPRMLSGWAKSTRFLRFDRRCRSERYEER